MTRDAGTAIDMSFLDYEEHRNKCTVCKPFGHCKTAMRLLREAAEEAARRLAPCPDICKPRAKA